MKSVVAKSRKSTMGQFSAWLKMPGLVLGLAVAAASGTTVVADEVRLPIARNVEQGSQQNMPRKGSSMAAIESRFGEPQRRTGAVGEPPISQWHYAEFVVYFENSHVIHTVAKRRNP